jgi:hypothetical protein
VTSVQAIELDLLRAEELGLKGCAVYRDGSMAGAAVLTAGDAAELRSGPARRAESGALLRQ